MADLTTWTGTNCTVTTVTEGTGVNAVSFLRVTRTGSNPSITSAAARSENGVIYRMFRALVRKHGGVAVATSWVGRLSWTTAGHGFSASYKNELVAPSGKAIDEWFPLTWDNTSPTAGGTDWSTSTITQLKIEFSDGSGDVWDIMLAGVGGTGATSLADTAQIIDFAVTGQGLATATPASYSGTTTRDLCSVTVTTTANDIVQIYGYSEIGSKTGPTDSNWVWDMVRTGGGTVALASRSIQMEAATVPWQDDANGLPQQALVYDTPGAGTFTYKMRATPNAPDDDIQVFVGKLVVARVKR